MTPASDSVRGQRALFPALAEGARHASDAKLVGIETFGLAASLAVYLWQPERVQAALPFIAIAMFGLWGVSEHFRRDLYFRAHGGTAAVAVFQSLVAAVGVLAAAAALFAVVGRAIGTIIS